MKLSVASRLSALYGVLLAITVVVVMVASGIALVIYLANFSGDIMTARHEQARVLADQFHAAGVPLKQAAPQLVNALDGEGVRVTVFDSKGNYLAGDKRCARAFSRAGLRRAVRRRHHQRLSAERRMDASARFRLCVVAADRSRLTALARSRLSMVALLPSRRRYRCRSCC